MLTTVIYLEKDFWVCWGELYTMIFPDKLLLRMSVMMGQIFQTDFILYFTEMICTRKTTSASLILVQNVLVSTIFFGPVVQTFDDNYHFVEYIN